jgi:hypothetical protein
MRTTVFAGQKLKLFLSRLYDTIGDSSKILFIFSELYKIFIFFWKISWIFGKAFEYVKTDVGHAERTVLYVCILLNQHLSKITKVIPITFKAA